MMSGKGKRIHLIVSPKALLMNSERKQKKKGEKHEMIMELVC